MAASQNDFETLAPKASGLSLKARAIGFLSRREHSRRELARKLAPHASDPLSLDALLDELERQDLLSDQRFAESLINRRAARHGAQRIAHELRQHGIAEAIIATLESTLLGNETERARHVWEKKFNVPPATAKEYARQYRFMISRGFTGDCVRTLLGDLPSGFRSMT